MNRVLCFLILWWVVPVKAQNQYQWVSIERTPCFGRCPAYILSVHRNGEVTYIGKKDAKFNGTFQSHVNPKKVRSIFQKYQNQKLAPLKDRYFDKVRDNSKLHVEIQYNRSRKYILNAQAGPLFLQKLAADLDSLISDPFLKWQPIEGKDTLESEPSLGTPDPDGVAQRMPSENRKEELFSFVEQLPEFPGGPMAMNQFVSSHVVYPETARDNGISGKVVISFVVEKDGQISHVKVRQGLGYGCDEEALRVVQSMPNWSPGKQNGQTVRVQYTLPILFHLSD